MSKYTIDEIFTMCESHYALVNLVAEKAREISEEAEKRKEPLLEKPVNIVLGNLRSGRSTIVSPTGSTNLFRDVDFDIDLSGALDD